MAWYNDLGDAWDAAKDVGRTVLDPLGLTKGAPQNSYRVPTGSLGLEHGDELYGQAQAGYAAAGGRKAPTVGASHANTAQVSTQREDQFRGQQMGLAQALASRVAGTAGPSIAEQQLRASTDRNVRQGLAMAASARGGASPLAMRNVAFNTAMANQEAAGQGALLRSQEQQAAEQSLGALLASGRSADQNVALSQAQLGQQANLANANLAQQAALANQGAALSQTGLNDAQQRAFLDALLGIDRSNQQGAIAVEGINSGVAAANAAAQAAHQAGVMSFGGDLLSLAAMGSDERLKRDVRPSGPMLDELMSRMDPYEYEYRDPHEGEGRRMGVMAQDVERSRLGEALVRRREDGMRALDVNRSLGAALASVARLDDRLRRVEGRR